MLCTIIKYHLVLTHPLIIRSYKYSTGWWLTYPSEKYEFVSWDDDIPDIWKNTSHVPNHHSAVPSGYLT